MFGRTGQVARELRLLSPVWALGRDAVDLSDPVTCGAAIKRYRPWAVINAAAYTAVDQAESEEALASVINGDAPFEMAKACSELNIPLVHISTDYVFAGTGSKPWSPHDDPAPINAYGRTKLAGETGIRASRACYAILRTSWVFSAFGSNFVKTMLRLAETRDEINVVDDQFGGPTPARAIASACLVIARQLRETPEKTGTYHFCGEPVTSWCGFAHDIFDAIDYPMRLNGIASTCYETAASRPLNSRLDCSATTVAFGLHQPNWRAGLKDCLTDLGFIK